MGTKLDFEPKAKGKNVTNARNNMPPPQLGAQL
jgi:hypothetical protein